MLVSNSALIFLSIYTHLKILQKNLGFKLSWRFLETETLARQTQAPTSYGQNYNMCGGDTHAQIIEYDILIKIKIKSDATTCMYR